MITLAKYLSYEILSATSYRIHCQITDDVKGVYEDGFVASGTTAADLRDDVSRQIAAKNALLSMKSVLDGIAVNFNIPVTAPVVSVPAQTAAQVWADKARRLARLKAMGTVSGALLTEIAALQTDVETSFSPGFTASV